MHPDRDFIFKDTVQFSGQRLDVVLSHLCSISRSKAQNLILKGYILINDIAVFKPGHIIQEGDSLSGNLNLATNTVIDLEPHDQPLDIVYEDQYLLIINKPAGLLTQPINQSTNNTLVNVLLHYYPKQLSTLDPNRPGLVNRLDKDTSGLIIVAKDNITHQLIIDMFVQKEIQKTYYALVWGHTKIQSNTIRTFYGRHPKDRTKYTAFDSPKEGRREAVTHWTNIESYFRDNKKASLLKISIETGRPHQIRVHMASIGHALIGDPIYSHTKTPLIKRQSLHSGELEFVHPRTQSKLKITSDLPEDLQQIVKYWKHEI